MRTGLKFRQSNLSCRIPRVSPGGSASGVVSVYESPEDATRYRSVHFRPVVHKQRGVRPNRTNPLEPPLLCVCVYVCAMAVEMIYAYCAYMVNLENLSPSFNHRMSLSIFIVSYLH